MTMIHVRQLVKDYGPRRAVDRLDLDVEAGQIVGILGPNGAGKTTTLRMLTCFMPPTSGTASINGHDIFTDSAGVRRTIGYLPESTPLYPEMKVAEQLHFFGKLHGLSRADRRRRIGELSGTCGLGEILHRPIGYLSKGNRQRVGLAQAMLHDPPVLILDEPTSGLDPHQITEVRKLIRHLGQTKTILLSTHILPEVEKTCQRVVIIHGGRVAAHGTPDELKAQVRSASRVVVEAKASGHELRRVLEGIDGVGAVTVESAGAWTTARVSTKRSGHDIREAVGEALLGHRWPIREMRFESASLEELFIQITSAPTAKAGAA